MCPACFATILAAVAGSAGGAGVLTWLGRQRRLAKRIVEPASATFQEWVASVLELDEALRATNVPPRLLMPSESRSGPSIGGL